MKTNAKTAQQYLHESFKYDELLSCLRYRRRPRNHFHSDESQQSYNLNFQDVIVGMTSNKKKGAYINFCFLSEDYIISVIKGAHKDSERTDLDWIRTYSV